MGDDLGEGAWSVRAAVQADGPLHLVRRAGHGHRRLHRDHRSALPHAASRGRRQRRRGPGADTALTDRLGIRRCQVRRARCDCSLLLGVFLFVGLQRDPSYVPSPLIGKPAPEFTLPSLQDANYPVPSKELLGQPWVLNVWGTWCAGCRAGARHAARDRAQTGGADRRPQLEGRQRCARSSGCATLGNPVCGGRRRIRRAARRSTGASTARRRRS